MKLPAALCCLLCYSSSPSFAHYENPADASVIPHAVASPHTHNRHHHDAILPNAEASIYTTRVWVSGDYRFVSSDGLPDEPHGAFPNSGNPNVISEQQYSFRMPVHPVELDQSMPEQPHLFGVALDGIPFDPGTAEFWRGDPHSGWHGEAMTGPMRLGLDMNNAHVQPSGAYHYHGIPTALFRRLPQRNHQTLVGYAADGFPIYVESLKSSYRLKSGSRPSGMQGPGGTCDGKYTEDYEYVSGLGDLDECNGRSGITAEFPKGTYYYVLTEAFPYVPRRWHGQPDLSFFKRPPPGGPVYNGRWAPPPAGRRVGNFDF